MSPLAELMLTMIESRPGVWTSELRRMTPLPSNEEWNAAYHELLRSGKVTRETGVGRRRKTLHYLAGAR